MIAIIRCSLHRDTQRMRRNVFTGKLFHMGIWTKANLVSAAASITMPMLCVSTSAEELWDPHLRGADEGLAAGASLPPGVYGVMNNYLAVYAQRDAGCHPRRFQHP